MIVIGCDPGISGALACIGHLGEVKKIVDMPVMQRFKNQKQVNPAALEEVLRSMIDGHDPRIEVQVVIESVHAMPKQGVHSVFSIGLTCGLIEGVVAAMKLPYELIRPEVWKKDAGLIKADTKAKSKDLARSKAIQLFPDASTMLSLVKHHNRAESLLIARWGYREYS